MGILASSCGDSIGCENQRKAFSNNDSLYMEDAASVGRKSPVLGCASEEVCSDGPLLEGSKDHRMGYTAEFLAILWEVSDETK